MSDEPLVYVAFNEPHCGRFELYDNEGPGEDAYALPQSLWRPISEAESADEVIPKRHLVAALDYIKANADPDDDVQDFQVDKNGIYW